MEQSLIPLPKFWFLHRHAAAGCEQPSAEYCATMLLKQVWPQEGRAVKSVAVAVCVAKAVEQYALPTEMTVLATEVPQAPLEQSRMPLVKLGLLHRQYTSPAAQPSAEYCPSMLFKQVLPHEGRES